MKNGPNFPIQTGGSILSYYQRPLHLIRQRQTTGEIEIELTSREFREPIAIY